jgi:hypothetical protein
MPAPLVVVGHSYGGSVITGVEGARHFVYVAAFVPDAGGRGEPRPVDAPDRVPATQPFADGTTLLDPVGASELMYGDCTPDRARWAVATAGAGVRTWSAGQTGVAVDTVDLCRVSRRSRARSGPQHRMTRRCGTSVAWPTGHAPFVSSPERFPA